MTQDKDRLRLRSVSGEDPSDDSRAILAYDHDFSQREKNTEGSCRSCPILGIVQVPLGTDDQVR